MHLARWFIAACFVNRLWSSHARVTVYPSCAITSNSFSRSLLELA